MKLHLVTSVAMKNTSSPSNQLVDFFAVDTVGVLCVGELVVSPAGVAVGVAAGVVTGVTAALGRVIPVTGRLAGGSTRSTTLILFYTAVKLQS